MNLADKTATTLRELLASRLNETKPCPRMHSFARGCKTSAVLLEAARVASEGNRVLFCGPNGRVLAIEPYEGA
jgi:hypothetical protein